MLHQTSVTSRSDVPTGIEPFRQIGFKLPLHLKQMGDPAHCRHRSGWQYVMAHLREASQPGGILLDDFVERSFQHPGDRQVWQEPWVGIFHHPPNLPGWLDPTAPPSAIFETEQFRASRPYLRGAIALSEYLGQWLREVLDCPVLVQKHPTEVPATRFEFDRWAAQPRINLVQVGWYARNTRAIYQVPVAANVRKMHLMQNRPWVIDAASRTDALSPLRDKAWQGDVEVMAELDDDHYDDLLSKSLIFNQYWDASASNTIIEAIARSTPVVVNRHPALLEYLGADYPLFFTDLSAVDPMIQDAALVRAAWSHLEAMDKSWLTGESFAQSVVKFVRSVSP